MVKINLERLKEGKMPTYKNTTTNRKTLGNKVIEPNQIICSLVYYNENEIELLKISDKPFYNPTIISKEIVAIEEIEIPKVDNLNLPLNKYNIHFFVEKGSIEINYNSKENKPSLFLYKEARWNQRCLERVIDRIFITPKEPDSKIWVIVEKF